MEDESSDSMKPDRRFASEKECATFPNSCTECVACFLSSTFSLTQVMHR